MALNLYTSNRMENLLDAAARTLQSPLPGSPLRPETVILQSKGMQRWFSMEMARRCGVWGNVRYPFPNRFVTDLFTAALPKMEQGRGYSPAIMRWRIMGLLPPLLENPAFRELKSYLAGSSGEMKLYELAGVIADLFDQYTLYRGEMITQWESGTGEGWQPLLWRAVAAATKGKHRETLRRAFLETVRSGTALTAPLPNRLTLFGISSLPRYYLDIFAALSLRLELNVFVLSPCEAYWGDLNRVTLTDSDPETGYGPGSTLLLSLGRLGRDFSNQLLDYDHLHGGSIDLYAATPGVSMLACLQNDLLDLGAGEAGPERIAATDRSITVQSCHSPLREIEVLYDQLLEMFETLEGLKPRDILIMTPDIELYAPYIAAVFDAQPEGAQRIPFSIADRSILSDGRGGEALLAILALPGSRFEAPLVMDILSAPPVAAAFGITTGEAALIRTWVEATRIRWGMNGADRELSGLPPYEEQSWRAGLDRLLTGLALPAEGESLFNAIFPYDNMEGDALKTLGKFAGFVESLYATITGLAHPRKLADWVEVCRKILTDFFVDEPGSAPQLAALQDLLADIATLPAEAGFNTPIPLQLFQTTLAEALASRQRGLGFMTGGVTFCAMLPMRSIPFRVIGMIGMNDGLYPRQDRSIGFDLIAANPRPGDRSLRNEDRYLFLEALLSARERLYLSYTGQGVRDNAPIPPSVLVSELLDYLDRRFPEDRGHLAATVHCCQKLQPFSHDYFSSQGGLFSYSAENCQGVKAIARRAASFPALLSTPLPPPPEESREIQLTSLLSFFRNPCSFFMTKRLGLRLEELDLPLEEREQFEIDPLDRYLLRERIITGLLRGDEPTAILPPVRAAGLLPPAAKGESDFQAALAHASEMTAAILQAQGEGEELAPLDIDLTLGEFRLKGRLTGIQPDSLFRWRCSRFSGRDAIRLWIEHLLLNLCEECSYPKTSLLLCRDKQVRLGPVADPAELLLELLELYWCGLSAPLRFFPRSSFEYAKRENFETAEKTWCGGDYPEAADPFYRLVFAERDPLGQEFPTLALRIFRPFNLALEKS